MNDELEHVAPRAEVVAFADHMERKLQANEHKGGWSGNSPLDLANRVREEHDEFQVAVLRAVCDEPGYDVAGEAADMANMAMMVVDVLGLLGSAPPSERALTGDGFRAWLQEATEEDMRAVFGDEQFERDAAAGGYVVRTTLKIEEQRRRIEGLEAEVGRLSVPPESTHEEAWGSLLGALEGVDPELRSTILGEVHVLRHHERAGMWETVGDTTYPPWTLRRKWEAAEAERNTLAEEVRELRSELESARADAKTLDGLRREAEDAYARLMEEQKDGTA